MKNEIKQKFPKWLKSKENDYNLMLSDDIDSLFSCIILNKLFGYKIRYFYDFYNIYKYNSIKKNVKGKTIGVDADLVHGKCWGNHVTLKNPDSANLNTVLNINKNNYYNKFAGSTLITILSYYNVNLSNMSKEQLEVLICIDTAFKQYYFNKDLFEKYYNKILEYPIFIKILENQNKNYFYNIIKEYNLHKNIYIKNGKLKTDIKLGKLKELFPNLPFSLPKNKFEILYKFNIVQSNYLKHNKKQIFSLARVYKNALRYSTI